MLLGFLMADQKPMCVTTNWLRKRVAVKNHDSLINGFWKFHSKSLVPFPGTGHSTCRAQVNTTLEFPSDFKNWPFKRFSTTMLRAMGPRKLTKRTTSISIDGFWNGICSIFPSWSLYIKGVLFELFGAYLEGDAVLQKVVHACVTTKCSVADKNHPETRVSRIGSVLCRWKEVWAWILWTWVKLDYWTKRAGTWSNDEWETFRL